MRRRTSLWCVACSLNLTSTQPQHPIPACRAQKWRDIQRTSGAMRQFHEHNAARSLSDECGGRSVLEIEGVLYSGEHSRLSFAVVFVLLCPVFVEGGWC